MRNADQKRCRGTRGFALVLGPLGELWGNRQEKVTSKTSLTNMSKSEKSAYFRHVSCYWLFLGAFFRDFFGGFGIGVRFCVFWYPYWIFNEKSSFTLIGAFCTLWLRVRGRRLEEVEGLFLWMCLRILVGNHQRVCITKMLGLLYPNDHTRNQIFLSDMQNFLSKSSLWSNQGS